MTAAGLMTAGIAPAQAAGMPVLPSNQHFFAVDCDDFLGSVFSIDTTNAASTLVGTGAPGSSVDCGYGAQSNPVDGTAYTLIGGATTYLATVDTTAGTLTKVADITGAVTDAWQLMITNSGAAYVMQSGMLYTLDLATGITSTVGSLVPNLGAAGYNPNDDTIYAFKGSGQAYAIDRTTGTATPDSAHNIVVPAFTCPDTNNADTAIDGVVFDANGNAWIQNDSHYGCVSSLLVEDFATGTTYHVGEFTDTAQSLYTSSPYHWYTETIFITTDAVETTLPNTGSSAGAMVTTFTIGAGLLAAGALALLMLRRRFVRQ